MSDFTPATPKALIEWLKQNKAPFNIVAAADIATQEAANRSTFDFILENIVDHPAADNPDILDFSSQFPEEVLAAKAIARRILTDPRLDIRRAK